MIQTELLIVLFASVAFAYVLVRSPSMAYGAFAALVAANGLYLDVGVGVTASRLFVIVAVPWLLVQLMSPASNVPRSLVHWCVGLLFYSLAVTFASYAFFAPPVAFGSPELRIEYRWIIQWVSFGISLVPILFAPAALRSADESLAALRWFILGAALLSAIAVAQWIADQFFGVELIGIAREGLLGDQFQVPRFELEGIEFTRANSFAREPKDLAAVIAIALSAIAIIGMPARSGHRMGRKIVLGIVATLLAGLAVTFSTTGILLLGAGLLFAVAWPVAAYAAGWGRIAKPVPSQMLLAIVGVLAVVYFSGGDILDMLLQDRLHSRLGQLEDFDQVTIDFLAETPEAWLTGVGLGLVPFYANDYLPGDPTLLAYMFHYAWDPKAGLLRILASLGILGVIGFAGLVRIVFRRIGPEPVRGAGPAVIEFRARCTAFLVYLTLVYAVRAIDEIFWCLAGILCAIGMATANTRTPVTSARAKTDDSAGLRHGCP